LNASTALGLANTAPVGGTVDRAAIARGIDEGFKQKHVLVEMGQPVGVDTTFAQGEYFGAQVRAMPVGQDQEAAVVGDQLETAVLVPIIPTNPAVARGAFQRRPREGQ